MFCRDLNMNFVKYWGPNLGFALDSTLSINLSLPDRIYNNLFPLLDCHMYYQRLVVCIQRRYNKCLFINNLDLFSGG